MVCHSRARRLPAKLGLTALPSSVAGPKPGDSMVSVSVIVSIIVRKRPARLDAGQGSQGIQRSSDGTSTSAPFRRGARLWRKRNPHYLLFRLPRISATHGDSAARRGPKKEI